MLSEPFPEPGSNVEPLSNLKNQDASQIDLDQFYISREALSPSFVGPEETENSTIVSERSSVPSIDEIVDASQVFSEQGYRDLLQCGKYFKPIVLAKKIGKEIKTISIIGEFHCVGSESARKFIDNFEHGACETGTSSKDVGIEVLPYKLVVVGVVLAVVSPFMAVMSGFYLMGIPGPEAEDRKAEDHSKREKGNFMSPIMYIRHKFGGTREGSEFDGKDFLPYRDTVLERISELGKCLRGFFSGMTKAAFTKEVPAKFSNEGSTIFSLEYKRKKNFFERAGDFVMLPAVSVMSSLVFVDLAVIGTGGLGWEVFGMPLSVASLGLNTLYGALLNLKKNYYPFRVKALLLGVITPLGIARDLAMAEELDEILCDNPVPKLVTGMGLAHKRGVAKALVINHGWKQLNSKPPLSTLRRPPSEKYPVLHHENSSSREVNHT